MKDLKVLNKAHKLVLGIYNITKIFPEEEKYRLVDQLCRASASVPTNIAEGKARKTNKEFIRFLVISRSSVEEVKYLLLLSKDLNYISLDLFTKFIDDYNEIGKMLNGLIKSLGVMQ
ncbi:MAG: four helix bundle protein [Thermodesulfobacteriota bacterium]